MERLPTYGCYYENFEDKLACIAFSVGMETDELYEFTYAGWKR